MLGPELAQAAHHLVGARRHTRAHKHTPPGGCTHTRARTHARASIAHREARVGMCLLNGGERERQRERQRERDRERGREREAEREREKQKDRETETEW